MQNAAAILIIVALTLASCVTRYKPPTVRTTTSHAGQFGASPFTTVTETPYESPAYRAAGEAMFTRQ